MLDESIERVVVIFPGALGDLLLALPALRLLRKRHAAAKLVLVVNDPLRSLAACADVADATAGLSGADTAGLFGAERLPPWLAGRPFVYSWLGAASDELRARLAAATRGVRFFRVERGDGLLHAAAAYARAVGAAKGARALAGASGLAPAPSPRAEMFLADVKAPVLVVHPGAGSRAKRWDAAGFVQVAEWWREMGGGVVEVAGPAEAEDPPLLGSPIVREWPLGDLAAVLSRAALYLGNDSGVSHLAGVVGAAGVVLFGPTDPGRWAPLGARLVALRARRTAPDGIPLSSLPAARVIAACQRRFALTRGDLDTSVGA
ncbi:MAG TPA: glycosyltransferase family 9 protein [Candidatus Nitrosopolaris sp.]|nr:glycosyltransferase family 9 protein [Candidatus Nitrosopolaris sp.]